MPDLKAAIVQVTPFQQNCLLLWDAEARRGSVFDPGGNAERIFAAVTQSGFTVDSILLTHGHLDHAGGAEALQALLAGAGQPVEIIGPDIRDKFLLDGTSRLGILWRICLPQMRGGLAATAIIAFVFTWNDFLFSQILTGQATRTIPIAMLRVLGADFGTDWGLFAAAGTIYLAPVMLVAFFLQNQLLRGATFGTMTR